MAANWAELHFDLLVLIAKRVKVIEDYIAFRGVCTSWRTAASKDNFDALYPQVPLLMLAEKDDDYREFYSISKGKVSRILHLPEARGRPCYPSDGWMVTMSYNGDYNGEFNLLHPFSHTQISLPSERNLWALQDVYEFDDYIKPHRFDRCIHKAVLSANPSITSDYVLAISYHTDTSHLAFWRPGDLNWTTFKIDDRIGGVSDIVYHKGQFYCVTWAGEICIFYIPGPSIPQPIVQSRVIDLQDEEHMFRQGGLQFYLVEVYGVLLLVTRFSRGEKVDGSDGGPDAYVTFKFKVYELDLIKAELKEINTLGTSTIFLGVNGSTSIDSSKFTGVKPNHIYFADDWDEVYTVFEGGGGRDMGVYNLEDKKVESFYPELSLSPICPPTWVTPSFQ